MNPLSGSIDFPEQLTKLEEIIYIYLFIINDNTKDTEEQLSGRDLRSKCWGRVWGSHGLLACHC
jgi:hypothetical protein